MSPATLSNALQSINQSINESVVYLLRNIIHSNNSSSDSNTSTWVSRTAAIYTRHKKAIIHGTGSGISGQPKHHITGLRSGVSFKCS